jgi:hypothetical protein
VRPTLAQSVRLLGSQELDLLLEYCPVRSCPGVILTQTVSSNFCHPKESTVAIHDPRLRDPVYSTLSTPPPVEPALL